VLHPTDQRGAGFPRIADGGLASSVDIGAVERESTDIRATLVGDYNVNGAVDAADYTVWRDHLGSTTYILSNRSPANTGPLARPITMSEDEFRHVSSRAGSGALAVSARTGETRSRDRPACDRLVFFASYSSPTSASLSTASRNVAIKPSRRGSRDAPKRSLAAPWRRQACSTHFTPPTGERKNSPVTDESDASGLEFDVTAGSNTINIELTSK